MKYKDLENSARNRLRADLDAYIKVHYVEEISLQENQCAEAECPVAAARYAEPRKAPCMPEPAPMILSEPSQKPKKKLSFPMPSFGARKATNAAKESLCQDFYEAAAEDFDFEEEHESKLNERMKHLSDTFSQYLLYMIREKGMENAEVYKRAVVDKKIFSKIKNNPEYHPQKLTALCLCVGAQLNLDETKDLLARAGYALSPCDKTDIIFSYFIENQIYDMIELDIQLEEHGLACIIQ